ncbi:hypothetical protein HN681_01405 [archaeon]|jgi:hypothetical protein|nr:hypothetical protein [archaeon]MBT3730569.1 hypothetical protein [archaeon]MBT4669471.1 hypothetical protein [archaeon]MBT5030228.1 hypothetical protein [archaeon]MBT5287673.1 hypothetical protein [archaeon]
MQRELSKNSIINVIRGIFSKKNTKEKPPQKEKPRLTKEQRREIIHKKRGLLVAFMKIHAIIENWKVVIKKEETKKPVTDENLKLLLLEAIKNLDIAVIKFNQIEIEFQINLFNEKSQLHEIMSLYHALYEHYHRPEVISQIKRTKIILEDIEKIHDLRIGVQQRKRMVA